VVEVVDVLFPPKRPSAAWIAEATRTIAAQLATFVRRDPSNWLWLHRRWKTRRPKQGDKNVGTGREPASVVASAAST
jgi:lauroyl/myristoyl acyltransferase